MFWIYPDFGVMAGFMFFIFAIAAGLFVFWLWMLVDALQRRKFEDKLIWVLVLLFLNVLGAVLYYALVKSKKKR